MTAPAAAPAVVPLREHLELRIAELARRVDDLRAADKTALDAALTSADKAVQAALAAQQREVSKAEQATNEKLRLLNELRTGVVMTPQLKALADKLELGLAQRDEKVDGVRRFMWLLSGMGVVMSIAIPIVVSLLLRSGK